MVTVRKLLLVLLSLAFFVSPEPFGLLPAEGQEKRTSKLIESAKKEKELVVWHIDDIDDDIVKAFETKYPFLNVKLWRDRGATMATKALEEAKAGVYSPDLCLFDDINGPRAGTISRILNGKGKRSPVLQERIRPYTRHSRGAKMIRS